MSKDYVAPVRASIDVTYACDLRCIHCRTNTGEIPTAIRRKMLSIEQLSQVMRDLDQMGTFEITLTGGEPTLRKGFWDLIEVVGDLRHSSTTLITNAANLSREQMDRIVDSGISGVRVSVDGTRDTFSAIRLSDVYDTVLQNCRYLAQRARSFRVLTTVMKQNLDNVFALTEELRAAGIRRQNYILVRAHGRGARTAGMLLTEEETMRLHRDVEQFRARVPRDEFDLELNAPYLVPGEQTRRSMDVVLYPYIVRDTSISISATGDVTMSRLYSSKPLGNVKDTSIADIWSNSRAEIAQEVEDYSDEELREIFWDFASETDTNRPVQLTALLDRQIFEGYEVR
ncbi:radical SAM protein [Pseudonocardia sp. HH130629-09]|uniref:radical SAM protein n=1 Tax=Pseudonocardia sp. HH130629-09 TaxID=1641402 RepID=UPI0006CB2E34|nr:radical SAM protein [Pseudonocardia sp. HH130629-09]ALE85406.1 radical SAM protein [Pseudonocardia sp. HH130629-09]